MTVLVFGASGLLGSNVVEVARRRNSDVIGTYRTTKPDLCVDRRSCDITARDDVSSLVEECDPDLVVNCAAMTDVDRCERSPDEAHAVNARAPGQIAHICSQKNVQFAHVSTDYVFDGRQQRRYAVDDETAPLQHYGRTKEAGERAVLSTDSSSLVVRLSFVYGNHQSSGTLTGFPAWVADQLRDGNEVPLFTDQHVTPSRAEQAAETLLELADASTDGLFHVACRDCVTPYEFGHEVARRLDGGGVITESTLSDVDRVAPRPAHTCLDVEKTETRLERPQPTLRDDLDRVTFD